MTIIQTALNQRAADLHIQNGRVANVLTGEIYPADVVIAGDQIAAVEAPETLPARLARRTLDAGGRLIVPGLVDSHLHIESSLVTPPAFAEAVLLAGTTTVAEDPHEVANATGLAGVRHFLQLSRDLPLTILFLASTCVPAAAGLEHCRGELGAAELAELLALEGVIGLAEVMDARAVIDEEPKMSAILHEGRRAGAIIEGHNPMLEGRELQAYIAAGVDSDHTLATAQRLLEKIRLGVTVQLQERYLDSTIIDAINALPQPPNSICLVTDDVAPDYLQAHGHLDHLLRRAVALGMPPMQALQAATINPARRLRLYDRGLIGPGRRADLLLVDELDSFNVSATISGGQIVAQDGELLWRAPAPTGAQQEALDALRDSLDLSPVTADDFLPDLPHVTGTVDVRVIVSHPQGTTTEEGRATVPLVEGAPQMAQSDLCLIAVIARGHKGRAVGFLRGLGLQEGAVATTHAHDSHNLAVFGRDRQSMATAANAVIAAGGGIALAVGQTVRALTPLPIAGILSDAPLNEVAAQMRHFSAEIAALGVQHPYLLMRLSTYTLPVSSGLRITDMGYVRARERALAPLLYA